MDLPWGDEKTVKFVTNVGLITSYGPNGPNIMAAEWTHQVSYSPGLIAISIGLGKTTNENIQVTREFGVSLAADDQNIIASIAGRSNGRQVNKIAALKELGFKFYNAKKIGTLMVSGAILNIECKVINIVEVGDHTLFIGEVLEVSANPEKHPLVYHGLKFSKLGEQIPKSEAQEVEKIQSVIQKHAKLEMPKTQAKDSGKAR